MKINLFDNQEQQEEKIELDTGLIKEASSYLASKFEKDDRVELNIIFTSAGHIRELNREYRGIDSPTDVLSFSYLSDKDSGTPVAGPFTAGEIIICPAVARDNSEKTGENWSILLEVIYLIIHGMLHIYDYDHVKEPDRIDMERIQDSLLKDLRNTFGI